MNTTQCHEPETKGFNKARDLQDAIIRSRRNGCGNPLDVSEDIYDWFINASRTVQISILQYAVARMWDVVSDKIIDGSTAEPASRKPSSPRSSALPKETLDDIKAKVTANLESQWLDLIIPMTGAQVRAAKILPDEMLCKVSDTQRVGDVFTADELRKIHAA